MDFENKSNDQHSDTNGTGDEDMAITEKELNDMHKTQTKKRVMTKEEKRRALIQLSIQKNYKALERLSRT